METININKATQEQLTGIIHIGPVRASLIIKNRPYKDLYELSRVPQLGKKRMDDIVKQKLAIV